MTVRQVDADDLTTLGADVLAGPAIVIELAPEPEPTDGTGATDGAGVTDGTDPPAPAPTDGTDPPAPAPRRRRPLEFTTTEDVAVIFPGSDPEPNPDGLVPVSPDFAGEAEVIDGSVVFTPASNFSGEATFTVDGRPVTIVVAGFADEPDLSVQPATVTASGAAVVVPLTIAAALNDPEGETLTVEISGFPDIAGLSQASFSAGTYDGSILTLTAEQASK